jgi:hypothetical protein
MGALTVQLRAEVLGHTPQGFRYYQIGFRCCADL